jgi:hypothetical protein
VEEDMSITINGEDLVLEVESAIGTLAECIEQEDILGSFDDYKYCAANGRQVLLGHHSGVRIDPGEIRRIRNLSRGKKGKVNSVNSVFVSKGLHHHKAAYTWEELREYLQNGWVIGTERYPGVKICFLSTDRNFQRKAERIFVLSSTENRQ